MGIQSKSGAKAIDLIGTKPALGTWGRHGAIAEVKYRADHKLPSYATPPAKPKR